MANYTISEEQKQQYAGICVLEYIINKPKYFDLLLNESDSDLEPVLEWLLVKEYIQIEDESRYTPTEKGKETLTKFMARYSEFLTMFDIFSAVDLGEGTFAFERYFEIENEDAWESYIHEERWEDLRVAVAEFKGIDPVEIVFMSFINENRFGRNQNGWQFDLLLGTVWNEILEICNTALTVDQLSYEDEEGVVDGKDVMADVITQGTTIMLELLKEEEELTPSTIDWNDEDYEGDEDRRMMDRVEIHHHQPMYYDPWLDPFYVSPIWVGLWLL